MLRRWRRHGGEKCVLYNGFKDHKIVYGISLNFDDCMLGMFDRSWRTWLLMKPTWSSTTLSTQRHSPRDRPCVFLSILLIRKKSRRLGSASGVGRSNAHITIVDTIFSLQSLFYIFYNAWCYMKVEKHSHSALIQWVINNKNGGNTISLLISSQLIIHIFIYFIK